MLTMMTDLCPGRRATMLSWLARRCGSPWLDLERKQVHCRRQAVPAPGRTAVTVMIDRPAQACVS
jgi:hypothetical protein